MNKYQEPKYKIEVKHSTSENCMGENVSGIDSVRLVNRQSGIPIPEDEPLFLIRAKDAFAMTALMAYLRALPPGPHKDAVSIRCAQFSNWQALHSTRLAPPTTVKDDGWTSAGTGGGSAPVSNSKPIEGRTTPITDSP